MKLDSDTVGNVALALILAGLLAIMVAVGCATTVQASHRDPSVIVERLLSRGYDARGAMVHWTSGRCIQAPSLGGCVPGAAKGCEIWVADEAPAGVLVHELMHCALWTRDGDGDCDHSDGYAWRVAGAI